MQLIKLSATDSTNAYLKGLMQVNNLEDFTVVTTDTQSKGRGQMGTSWLSESGKNLTFSVLKRFCGVRVEDQFRINMCVSLALYAALEPLNVPDLKIKWPNDILSGHSKICGILIENVLSGQNIHSSIIGIGLNVNQLGFRKLPNVSSLKLLLGQTFDLEELLFAIVGHFKRFLVNIGDGQFEELQNSYEDKLFRKEKPSTFKNMGGQLFMGFIKGVSRSGKLMILLEDGVLKEFDLKEVKLMY